MQRHRLFLVGVMVAVLWSYAPQAAPVGRAGHAVAGGGAVDVTDDFAGFFEGAGSFGLTASQQPDGSAFGQINFVFRGDFAAAWGACPFDPRCVPDTATNTFHLTGPVTGLSTDNGSIQITGLLTETDHGRGDGVIFEELDVPFVITFTEGSSSFVFQWCLLPPFTIDSRGGLRVNASSAPTTLLATPGSHLSSAVRLVTARAPLRQCAGRTRT